MKTLTLHSKLIDLQGGIISQSEGELFVSLMRKVLDLKDSGQITIKEAGTRIRKGAWKIAEDLRMNDLDLSAGSDHSLLENLPSMLKV